MQGVERYKVKLLPHSNEWDKEFLRTKEQIEKIWGSNVIDIQHVGSTSIKSICAKPILDVAVKLKSIENMDAEKMKMLGYDFCGAQNEQKTYYLFVLRGENEISLQHIHCYGSQDKEYFQLVAFRDYLNNHDDVVKQYEQLKIKLAQKYENNRKAYTAGKEAFIKSIYEKLG